MANAADPRSAKDGSSGVARRRVLVTGGAGYIGSHVVRALEEAGFDLTVVDLLRTDGGTGNAWAVPKSVRLVQGNCGDPGVLGSLLPEGESFDAIFHFAASIVIEESIREPQRYYQNNVVNSIRLFRYAVATGVPAIIFSSTGATYGESSAEFISEEDDQRPISPYGASKKMAEGILRDLCQWSESSAPPVRAASLTHGRTRGTRFVTLRYFNPAGAHETLEIGQARPHATHIVNVAAEAALGVREKVLVCGTDYPTPDGTCLRDYLHIQDVTTAHLSALRYLDAGGTSDFFNVGYGRPYSVLEVIYAMKRVSGVDFRVESVSRRPGDPARLAANPEKIQRVLGWKPRHDSLDVICESHFRWEKKRRESKDLA